MAPTPPRLKADTLKSESLSQQLNAYALASCAAGVSLLALVHPAEAEVVYTPAHVAIANNSSYHLDLNNDGITDFTIRKMTTHTSSGRGNMLSFERVPAGNGFVGATYFYEVFVSAISRGKAISSQKKFTGAAGGLMARYRTLAQGGSWLGEWQDVTNFFVGLKFVIGGQTHYGWARMNVHLNGFSIQAYLTGYAYETVPGKLIRTGQTSGPAENPALIPDSESSADSPPQASIAQSHWPVARHASLGTLALGAKALQLWRREERLS